MNTAICSRVTAPVGQKFPPPHPPTTPRRASSSTQRQKGDAAGTSPNTGVVQAGGSRAGSSVRRTNTAICSRVTAAVGQKFPPPQPATTPRLASSSIHLQKGLLAGTSANIG